MSASSSPDGGIGRTVHRPVLLREVLELLDLQPGLTVVDATVGGGGHSRHILKHIGREGLLIGLDRDPAMLEQARSVLPAENCRLVHASYSQLRQILDDLHVDFADRILLDLGVSSDQLADEQRGFSFAAAGPLDLRFDPAEGRPAWQLLADATQEELEALFRDFGEERFSRLIAREIVRSRQAQGVRTARELRALVRRALPARVCSRSRRDPATRIFQALRMAVNNEQPILQHTLEHALPETLRAGGRAAVITFHSLEDRLVKTAFRNKDQWQNLTPKPIVPTAAEKKVNPRSRSARLRAAVRKPLSR